MLPIIKAYAEGKEIEIFDKTQKMWKTVMLPHFDCDSKIYRIKPEREYRPFKDAEECWQEMQKHQPFGVVKDKYFANYQTHRAFTCLITNRCDFGGYEDETFETCFKNLLFADDTPFGVKVEE
nr:MAG TPA: hypothetical protein [Caudoviricetes sp.]